MNIPSQLKQNKSHIIIFINILRKVLHHMFGFSSQSKYTDYREFLTQEEATKYQTQKYGAYCAQYLRKNDIMRNYDYKIGEMGYYIEGYLGNIYSYINKYMREGKTDNERYNALIDRLNELIFCAPQTDENIIVYRGVDNNAINIISKQANSPGDDYTEKAFMSTSLRLETVLREFPSYNYILKIYVSKGMYALGTDNIKNRGEEELLFPEKQRLRYITKTYNKDINKYIYEFELVNYYLPIT